MSEKQKSQKMTYDEYWENVVGKVAKTQKQITTQLEDLFSFLQEIIETHAVIPEQKVK